MSEASDKQKRIIGIDIDDVLIDTHGSRLNDFYNDRFGTSWKKEDYFSIKLEEVWGNTKEEAAALVEEYINSNYHDSSPPHEYAKEAIAELSKHNSLVLITARKEEMREKTLAIIQTHFPDTFSEVHFTNHYFAGDKAVKKSDVCKELGVSIFIDDTLHNAEDISAAGIPVLLLDQPWNQADALPPLVTRVFSWKEILERLS